MQWCEVERVVTHWTIVQHMPHARVGVAQFAECCVKSPGCEPGCEHRCEPGCEPRGEPGCEHRCEPRCEPGWEHRCEPGGGDPGAGKPILVWFLLLR